MMPGPQAQRRIEFRRNYSAFLLGVSWVHDASWDERTTHFYLGWWTLTYRGAPRG
jgi:hypothetical protein